MKKIKYKNQSAICYKILMSLMIVYCFYSFEVVAKPIKLVGSKFSTKVYDINSIDPKDTLEVAVASTTKLMMEAVKPAFESYKKDIVIATSNGATGDMVEQVISGKAKVAVTTRNRKDYEIAKCPTLVGTPIGFDGLAIVVSGLLPVKNLTFGELQSIWTGRIINWKELGGPDLPIVLIGRSKAYDSIMLFCDFMKLESKAVDGGLIYRDKNKEIWCETLVAAPETDNEALNILLETPGAITYFPLQVLNNYKAKNKNLKSISFNGVQPTKETIANGTYFIHRTLNAITNGNPEGKTKDFCDYLLSEVGQRLIVESGFLKL